MKCTTVIDNSREEEIVIYTKKRHKLIDDIEALCATDGVEFLGYKDGQIINFSPSDVHCFSIEDGKVYAILENERLLMKERLYEIEESLGKNFIKINQSSIANIKKIQRFDASISGTLVVFFKNGYKDYVSRRQIKSIKERLGI